ncbi:hypothetical protein B566_EDAN001852 [Ephemera danica]|nr:hypothetical protein B566_EDAN001852 [Ephemera danica]
MSPSAMHRTTAGQIVNLMSNDVARFDMAAVYVNQGWIAPLELLLCCFVMWMKMGPSIMVGVTALLLTIPLQSSISHLAELRISIQRIQTSLIQAVLGELPLLSGSRKVKGQLSYVAQEPWLFSVDAHVSRHLMEDCIMGLLRTKCVLLATHQLQFLPYASHIIVLDNGRIEAEGTYYNLKDDLELDLCRSLVEESDAEVEQEKIVRHNSLLNVRAIVRQISHRLAASGTDIWVTYWTNIEESRELLNMSDLYDVTNITSPTMTSSWSTETCIWIHTGLIATLLAATLIRTALFVNTSMRCSVKLHDTMFAAISRSTMAFFNNNPAGMGKDILGGNVGLAITQSMGLTGMFQWGMRQSAEVENNMTAVERVVEFCDLESEPPLETVVEVPRNWPENGSFRKNLDPFDEYTDASLWKALEEVELKDVVSELPHGLESRMSEGGEWLDNRHRD